MVDRQITQCLEQWESITVREAEAIEGQDWEALKGLHQSKAEMMEQLDGWLAQKEVDRSAFSPWLRVCCVWKCATVSPSRKKTRDFARPDESDPGFSSGDWGRFAQPMEVTIDKRPCSSITPDQGTTPTI